ncbi:rho-related GTP-binding protein RhoN [Mastomys coucha]|uniref:rho-related GTP-binding protein RhoN n=1 Tax=Mastomys coucha TaxID=35658 RepID=UPI0012623A7F|nr:rho-related GTP-binding protein RhoN [Mastomys coucha]
MEGQSGRCKIVVVGDAECGKTALLQVFAKDAYPGSYVPTVFENYTASFEIDKRRIELNMWDTSGSSYYDNVRPLAYPDSDAVLISLRGPVGPFSPSPSSHLVEKEAVCRNQASLKQDAEASNSV